jgi:hypothetical protein
MSSVDLTWQDIREVLVNVGFIIEEEYTGVESRYTADVKSMMNMSYRCVHFVARKKVIAVMKPGEAMKDVPKAVEELKGANESKEA